MNTSDPPVPSAAPKATNTCGAPDKTASKTAYLTEQVKNLEEAVEATNLLLAYDGKTTYLEVLTAQSSLLNAQISLLSTELAREQALINLYQSLGGGR